MLGLQMAVLKDEQMAEHSALQKVESWVWHSAARKEQKKADAMVEK